MAHVLNKSVISLSLFLSLSPNFLHFLPDCDNLHEIVSDIFDKET